MKFTASDYRAKIGGSQTESVLISQIQHGLAREFEQSDPDRRLRLLLSELLFIMSQVDASTVPVLSSVCVASQCEVEVG